MDPVELLTVVVEASIALIGFSGLVVVLGRRSSGEWLAADRIRLVVLLAIGFALLACALMALTLLSAGLSDAIVWAWSSVAWVVLIMPVVAWVVSRVVRDPAEPTGGMTYYLLSILVVTSATAVLQVANAARLAEFWPFMLALAVVLLIGVTQFFRLLWFGLFR